MAVEYPIVTIDFTQGQKGEPFDYDRLCRTRFGTIMWFDDVLVELCMVERIFRTVDHGDSFSEEERIRLYLVNRWGDYTYTIAPTPVDSRDDGWNLCTLSLPLSDVHRLRKWWPVTVDAELFDAMEVINYTPRTYIRGFGFV